MRFPTSFLRRNPLKPIHTGRFNIRMSSSIPIIVCGKSEAVGGPVIEGLKPDIEVIHFISSVEMGTEQLPGILSGSPPTDSKTLGTQNWDRAPKAVVLGGAFDDEAIGILRRAVQAKEDAKRIHWLKMDKSVQMPPLGPEYPKRVIERTKAALIKMDKEGILDDGNDDVLLF